jgi:hypothetical protein
MANLSEVLAGIRQHESRGNYNLTPQQNYDYPNSHASGAYQFQPATWQSWTRQSGIGGQYSEAYQAPPNVQDAVAAYAAIHGPGVNSTALWGGPQGGGYAPITNVDVSPEQYASGQGGTPSVTASNQPPAVTYGPDGTPQTTVTGRPPGATGGTAGTTASTGSTAGLAAAAGLPGYLPPVLVGGPISFGVTPGIAAAVQADVASTQQTAQTIASGAETATGNAFRAAWSGLLGSIANWVERWFLVVLAVVIIAVAAWHLMDPEGPQLAVRRVKAAVA